MILKDLLPKYKKVNIEYRTFGPDNEDILSGYCEWNGKELIPLDGDDYSVDDRLLSFLWNGENNLTVWYESKWISG